MPAKKHTLSASGVRVADDFRDNLVVDRYHPSFVSMRQSKKKHLRSENSEDAVSWNVFRSFRQIQPNKWVPFLFREAFAVEAPGSLDDTSVELWRDVPPPPGLLETGDEGISEIDIVLENPDWVWFMEAKYKSDISEGTTTRPDRDQILRNIDVGSYYAGVRPFYFTLLVLDENRSPKGVAAVEKYRSVDILRAALPHRKDGLGNLTGIGVLTWSTLARALMQAVENLNRPDESLFAERAIEWLRGRGIPRDENSPS